MHMIIHEFSAWYHRSVTGVRVGRCSMVNVGVNDRLRDARLAESAGVYDICVRLYEPYIKLCRDNVVTDIALILSMCERKIKNEQ